MWPSMTSVLPHGRELRPVGQAPEVAQDLAGQILHIVNHLAQWIGLGEKKYWFKPHIYWENTGKNHITGKIMENNSGFRLRFSLKPIHWLAAWLFPHLRLDFFVLKIGKIHWWVTWNEKSWNEIAHNMPCLKIVPILWFPLLRHWMKSLLYIYYISYIHMKKP